MIHNLTMLCLNIRNIAIISLSNVGYRCTKHNISKSAAINLLRNSLLEDPGYIWKSIALIFSQLKAF